MLLTLSTVQKYLHNLIYWWLNKMLCFKHILLYGTYISYVAGQKSSIHTSNFWNNTNSAWDRTIMRENFTYYNELIMQVAKLHVHTRPFPQIQSHITFTKLVLGCWKLICSRMNAPLFVVNCWVNLWRTSTSEPNLKYV